MSAAGGIVYVIVGGNRGIGLSLVKELSNREGVTVFASAREPGSASELKDWSKTHSNVHIIKLDVTSLRSAKDAAMQVEKVVKCIDVLWVNSGISKSFQPVLKTSDELWMSHYQTNVLGPIHVYQAFYHLLKEGKVKNIVFTSSMAACMGGVRPNTYSAYGQSKAALNYTMKEISFELEKDGFVVVSIHPGVVNTDMFVNAMQKLASKYPEMVESIKSNAISPEQSASSMLKIVDNLKTEDNGMFYNLDGTKLPF